MTLSLTRKLALGLLITSAMGAQIYTLILITAKGWRP